MYIFKLIKGHTLNAGNLLVMSSVTVKLLWKKRGKMLALQRQSCGNNRKTKLALALCCGKDDFAGPSKAEETLHPS